jgi:hypothetical protein
MSESGGGVTGSTRGIQRSLHYPGELLERWRHTERKPKQAEQLRNQTASFARGDFLETEERGAS